MIAGMDSDVRSDTSSRGRLNALSNAAVSNHKKLDALLSGEFKLLIGGQLRDARDGATFPVVSPESEEMIARAPDASPEDVDEAVLAANDAFQFWKLLGVPARAERLLAFANAVERHAEALSLLDVSAGIPIAHMRQEIDWAVSTVRYFAGISLELKGDTVPASANLHFTIREPFGVVARILPFNHPVEGAISKIAAPLVAGNTVIMKPSDLTPLSALYVGAIARDFFPAGVVSFLTGSGAAVPDRLVRHPLIRRVGFIGSERVGRKILQSAAETGIKTVTLELGGKNALVAYPDADPEAVAAGAVKGMNFRVSGQSCGSTSRLIVHESIADEVTERVAIKLKDIVVGSPFDPDTMQGPLVSSVQFERVLGLIERAASGGVPVLAGGRRPAGIDRGYFVAPTLLGCTDRDAEIARTEVFGPVLTVLRWADGEDPIAMANEVEYGLTGSVYSNDLRTVHEAIRSLDVGYVWVNGSSQNFLGLPFGGFKASGIGREAAFEELQSYTQNKSVSVMM